nr:hypothetical protein BaRGS_008659 [Batillaria attramentaria]
MVTQTSRVQTDVETVKADSNVIRQELETLRQDNVNVKTDLTSKITMASKRVSFYAWVAGGPYNRGDTMTGHRTITNDGGAYNRTSGMFTVPISGVYIFLATVAVGHNSSRSTDDKVYIDTDTSQLQADSVAMVTQTARVQTDVETVKADSNVIRQELETLRQDNVNVKTDLTAKLTTVAVSPGSSRKIDQSVKIFVDLRAVGECYSSYTDHVDAEGFHSILHLRAGQRVYLSNTYDNATYIADSTSFSGALLHADLSSLT